MAVVSVQPEYIGADRAFKVGSDRAFKLGAVIVLAILYFFFIDRFSADLNGQRYFSLSDDQMISMRYAENLASGNGLVWNPGEPIEGFTNPLWTAYMTIWHLTQIPRSKISLAIMLTSALILILNSLVVYAIARKLSPDSVMVARVAMVFAGTYWSLVQWSLDGFEVGLTAVLISVVALQSFVYMESRRTRQLAVIALCIVALGWTRLEMLAVAGVPVAYLLLMDRSRWRVVSVVVVPVAVSVVMLFVARHWYYGEWLPNTYYLKLTGVALADRMQYGLNMLSQSLLTHFSIVLVPLLWLIPGFKGQHRIWILTSMFAMATLYTVYIGGDTWERPYHGNRFMSAMAPLIVLVTLHLVWARMARMRRSPFLSELVVVAVAALMAVGCSGRSFYGWARTDWQNTKLFAMVALGVQLREEAPVDSKVAVVWAGALPYFSRLYTVDLLGKTDKVIARSRPHSMGWGHNKWNYAYSVGVLKPDYIIELWYPNDEDIGLIRKLGYVRERNGMYVRTTH